MKKKIYIILVILGVLLLITSGIFLYEKVYLDKKANIQFQLIGEKNITLKFGEEYEELGAKASFRKQDISSDIKITSNIDNTKIGTYDIKYTVNHKDKKKTLKRTVTVIDDVKPNLILNGDMEVSYTTGEEYSESGYTASDNYDGDLTSKVVVTNNINSAEEGTYEVKYTVTDTSGNVTEMVRTVSYTKPSLKTPPNENSIATQIAVLNYHFFSDPSIGEEVGDTNYISVQSFEEQLQYLTENNYKTLTMEEFRAWMYGEITLPARSVLITIDDGARGTGFHNGNKLIPLLEKYQVHATLFLITGWWDISNYQSEYLDIESHTNDMHTSNYCSGVSRGAKILCISDDEVLQDLRTSISITGSDTAFCFPFYAYSDHAIDLVKEAGFKLAFVGGDYKASQSSDKYKIPRYHIRRDITLSQFSYMVG